MVHRPLTTPFVFTGTLRDEQKVVRNESMDALNQQQSVILSTHVGFGKSILAVYFAYKIQLKTLIIVNRLVLMQQWEGVLKQFIQDPKIQVIKPNKMIDLDHDFFIVNAINLPKLGYMPEIGLVLVDEVHLIVSKVLSTCFQYLTPQYLIGLSATPYRNDGMDILLDLHFGKI
jgi:superfamily II DNA or RNA helicase